MKEKYKNLQNKNKKRQKRARGAEVIVEGGEINDFDVYLS